MVITDLDVFEALKELGFEFEDCLIRLTKF